MAPWVLPQTLFITPTDVYPPCIAPDAAPALHAPREPVTSVQAGVVEVFGVVADGWNGGVEVLRAKFGVVGGTWVVGDGNGGVEEAHSRRGAKEQAAHHSLRLVAVAM